MRVNHVKACRKSPGECGACGKVIEIGQPYKWAKGRYTAKKIRCEKCLFKPSDLTSSKMGTIYDAQEDAQKNIDGWDGEDGSVDDLRSALEELASVVNEVAEEYRDSASSVNDVVQNNPMAEEWEEKADSLESWAGELEGASLEDYDEDNEQSKDDWVEEQRSEARGVVENCPE